MKLRWRIAQSLEKRWWRRYLSGRNVDEYHSWKSNYWHGFLQDLKIDVPQNQHILDAGCGPAGIFMILEGNEVLAVDPLLESYERLDHFQTSDYPWTNFQATPFEQFIGPKFDLIFCVNAINHFNGLTAGYQKLIDHLKPHGRLIISTDCHRYSFFKYLFRFFRFDALHPHQNDKDEHEKIIKKIGGEVSSMSVSRHDFFFDYVVFDVRITEK